ncbi:hypothetical protein ACFFSW_31910 [Saccharothrix longispora]|uniref:Mce-associated membrane protein n=1 Tax=Saccharothrix longispora TaxID=33920 RepID=A0ABU1Q2X2_9PSEU|nr:hypothetical protein [Saccharothrix longispora]MDR6596754.1 hypothetical protein [Saccharothrix longispora]
MDIGEQERSGRHRVDDRVAVRLPDIGDPPPAAALSLPAQRARDPFVDTDAVGLRKFDIGLVPASVTPPRTWRRAAWFAVLSSAAVLVGLAVVASELVGPVGPAERIGMPGYPTDVPLLTRFPSGTPSTAGTTAVPTPDDRRTAPGPRVDVLRAGSGDGSPEERGGVPGGPSGTRSGGRAPDVTVLPPSAPGVTTVPGDSAPLVDVEDVATLTERFYEEAVRNAGTAVAMVSAAFRPDARALLEQRYADVSLVEVKQISVDPARGTTTSTILVTRADGSTSTERWELVFTTGDEPLIAAERPAGSA